jgi:putative transposase
MKHHQRNASRKRRINGVRSQSARLAKEDVKAASIYRKLTNIRRNYIHQTTHTLVSMRPKRITMEDLNLIAMMKNHYLAKAIAEQCFAEFIRQMRYKSAWNGIEFQQALRIYPSSKTCSCCGYIKRDLKLKERTYVCDICGISIDRDFNAALNLERYDGKTKRAVGPRASLCP